MSFISSASEADKAAAAAREAFGRAEDPGVAKLAESVEHLAKAVAELARTHHRGS